MPAHTENNRTGRSVLDYQNTDELISALGSCRLHENEVVSDWILPCNAGNNGAFSSSYEPHSQETEAQRLTVLRDHGVLETDSEESLDAITKQAAERFNVPWAMLSLVDLGRQWFKSTHNTNRELGVKESPRHQSFCAHAIQQKRTEGKDDVFVVSNASEDPRFSSSPLVTESHPKIQFYAGVPLTVSEGVRLGTLCIVDQKPRPNGLSQQEREDLKDMATEVTKLLIERKKSLIGPSATKGGQESESQTRGNINCVTRRTSATKHKAVEIQDETYSRGNAICDEPSKKSRTSDLLNVAKTASTLPVLIPKPELQVLLPDPKTEGIDPDTYLTQLVEALYGVKLQLKTGLELNEYFSQITEEQMSAYSMDVVSMARTNNTKGLKEIFHSNGRQALDCFNRFGEGLLNICCRRGFTSSVEFLLSKEVNLNVRVRDDFGRTPLHDACWNPEPLTDICKILMEKDPALFFITDKRGYTPFQYARTTDWPLWRQFLFDNRHLLATLVAPETRKRFS